MPANTLQKLHQLATLYGVQTTYYDVARRRRHARPESLMAVLRALGVPVGTHHDILAALRERRQAPWKHGVEPVVVAWEGAPGELELRLPRDQAAGHLAAHVTLADGDVQSWGLDLDSLQTLQAIQIEGVRYVSKQIMLPGPLPWGYHRLALESRGSLFEATIISAPSKAFAPLGKQGNKTWGVFLPLYALHSQRSWGGGDFKDLDEMMEWVAELGGGVVATLPLLAAFLDKPCDPGPYAPVSRLFWNEFYIDIANIPELKRCPSARRLLESSGMQGELEDLRASPSVDYRRQMSLKRRVLEELARCLWAESSERNADLWRFVESHPTLEDYAIFRSACERQRAPWPEWPMPLREGVLRDRDFDEEAKRYHLYVQWVVREQLHALSEKARQKGQALYLDLPLGVHPHGYDVWRERTAFALEACGGAPPDTVFTNGQNWGFPPLHPGRIREQGYRYLIAYLGQHLNYAGLLRIDHVMGLHRLFWIPSGTEPRDGVYVRYPAEELYAILALESNRYKCGIVGENLGTVPPYVHPTMVRHNVHRMYVAQYELTPSTRKPFRAISPDSVASLNTHDMPTFAAFWQGLDVEDRLELGLLDRRGARSEQKARQTLKKNLVTFLKRGGWLKGASQDMGALLRACAAFLSASPARLVLLNLEDLWLETQPQNVPNTLAERPNWTRKARYSLETFSKISHILETLGEVDDLRRRGRS